MARHPNSLSVLIVDNTPQILISLARLFRTNNIRALLARDSSEACAIARRDYVPIDLVLANTVAPGLDAYQAVEVLRAIRPGLRALYMSARLDRGVIRLELTTEGKGSGPLFILAPGSAETGDLIQSIRSACTQPLRRAAGATEGPAGWTVQ